MSQFYASNPARVDIEIGRYLLMQPKALFFPILLLVASPFLLAISWELAAAIAATGIGTLIFDIIHAKKLFDGGDTLAAVVVDPKRQLVAVYADLSKGGSVVPVIKIMKLPINRILGRKSEIDDRLAYIALYNGHNWASQWISFGGYLVNSGTSDPSRAQRVVNRIPEEDWRQLIIGCTQIPRPFRVGQYEHLDL